MGTAARKRARSAPAAYDRPRIGGAAVFAPDCVRETFRPSTEHGGHDGDGRALRYLMWTTDPDPTDSTYAVDFAYLLAEGEGPPRCVAERHVNGLFGQDDWLRLLVGVGFNVRAVTRPYPGGDGPYETLVTFVAAKGRDVGASSGEPS